MNNKKIAAEIMLIAKSLYAANVDEVRSGEDEFVVIKKLKLKKKEGGDTKLSLENAQLILDAGYDLEDATMTYNTNTAQYELKATFSKGNDRPFHVFKGLSFGYGGQGPRGLISFGKMFGITLDENKVTSREMLKKGEKGTIDLIEFV